MTNLWLIRHGEAHVNHPNPDGSYTMLDVDGLTPRGIDQAEHLRDRLVLEGLTPDAVITSSFPRALQTATIVCEGLAITPEVSDDIQEWRPGADLERLPASEAEGSWERILAGHDHDVRISPQSESHNEFLARADQALEHMAEQHADQTVLVFTHGGIIDRSFVTFLGLPHRSALLGLRTRHTAITEWRQFDAFGRRTWMLARYNDIGHLDSGEDAETLR